MFTKLWGDSSSNSVLEVGHFCTDMEEQLKQLQEVVTKLRAENESLRQRPQSSSSASAESTASSNRSNPSVERLVFVPRDRKCPVFRGRVGISLGDWLEEAEACMRARHLVTADKAFFLFDHLDGEAREEIKFRSAEERSDPAKIIAILEELYGCAESYVALQEAFFSRRQHEGETLLEYSLALKSLMERVKQRAPNNFSNSETLLRDQFVEQVLDSDLRRSLKQYVRQTPAATLLDVRGEAMRWEREGLPACVRGRSNSVPSALGIQYMVQGGHQHLDSGSAKSEVGEMKVLLQRLQEQQDKLAQSIAQLQTSHQRTRSPFFRSRSPRSGPIICNRCQQPGHIARECDGRRVPFHSQSAVRGQFHPPQPSEN